MLRKRTGIFCLFFALVLPLTCGGQRRPAVLSPEQTVLGDALISVGMQVERTALDCSHFVNSVFEKAGVLYKYEPSRVLYRGAPGFKRVLTPAEGDLIVWPGHVGIVVDPQQKTFLSKLNHGIKVASYTSRYWRGRGRPRFFRYSAPIPDSTWLAWNGQLTTSMP